MNGPSDDEYESSADIDQFLMKIKVGEDTQHNPRDGTVLPDKNSIKKVWFFDAQWSDCPSFVEDEVRELWCEMGLGNDYYFARATVDEELFKQYPNIYFWLVHKNIPIGDEVMIHWWW